MKNNRTINSTKNLVVALIFQVVAVILKFVIRTIFIKTLGTAYLGINGLFSDILTMLSLAELGVDTVMTYRLYKPLQENDVQKLQLWIKFYKYIYLLVGIVIIVLGLCLMPFLQYLIKDYSKIEELKLNPYLIFGLYLFNSASSYFFMAYRSSLLRADQKMYIITTVNIFSLVIGSVLQILVLYMFKNFVLYIVVGFSINIIQNLTCALIATKMYSVVFKKTNDFVSKEDRKAFYKDLGAVSFGKINNVVLKGTDNIVISSFIGLIMVGIYSNYLLLYTTIKTILGTLYNAVKASMGNLFAGSNLEKKYKFFKEMNFITIILYGTAAIGIGIIANEFIDTWIGSDYIIAFPFPILIGIEILFMGIKQNLNQIRNVSGLFKQMWFRPLIGSIINICVSIVLVQFIGIYGVIIGTISADILSNFFVDPRIIHKYGFEGKWKVSNYYYRNIRYILELCLIGLGDYYLCNYILVGYSWWSVIFHTIICGISVPLIMVILHWKSDERIYLFSIIKNLINRFKRREEINND